jgi:outer membrane protein assembly factor BamB
MNTRARNAIALLLVAGLVAGCGARRTIDEWLNFTGTKTKIQGERIAIIASNQELATDPQLANAKMDLPAPKRNMEWAEPGGSPDNMIGNLTTDGPLSQIWSVSAGKGSDGESRLTAPPIVAGGLVYVLDAEAHVYAFDAATGREAWDVSLVPENIGRASAGWLGFIGGSGNTAKGFGGGLAFNNGKLYAATGFATVTAMDAKTGNKIWSVNTVVPIHSAPVVADNRVYIITQENQTLALDVNDGRTLWDHRGTVESAGIMSSASVGVVGDTVVVPYSSGELFALRAQNGTPAWNDTLTRTGNVTALTVINDIAGRPVIDRNMVFAVSHSGTFAAINLRSGSRAWTRSIPGIQTPLVAGEFVFTVSTEGQVVCMSRNDGRIRWVTQLEAFGDAASKLDPIVWTGPLMVSNFLVLVGSNGKAQLLSPFNGQKLGETDMPDGTFIQPVVANGMMYVLTNDAQLVALR